MTFGDDLKDQLPAIDKFTLNGIAFGQDLRDFLKERTQLERDFAHRLDALGKKYSSKKDRLGAALMDVASQQLTVDKYGTLFKAWEALLTCTEELSKVKTQLAHQLSASVTDNLKLLLHKKEEARKKHLAHSQKLTEERNKAYADKEKAKEKYEHMCDVVDQSKQRQEKAPDEKSADRLKKQYQADIVEMNNSKNNYIIAVAVANSFKKRFFYTDMPQLMDQLQHSNESRISQIQQLTQEVAVLESASLAQSQVLIDNFKLAIDAVAPEADTALFAVYHKPAIPWQEPHDFKFEPTLLWKDSDQLTVDTQSRIYLQNRQGKTDEKLTQTITELEVKRKELDGLRNLFDAYTKTPSMGDTEDVAENMVETMRAISMLELARERYQVTYNIITSAIGDSQGVTRHTLVKSTFAIPTSCDYCGEKIWGLTQQGFTCKECSYNCHAKCEMKVPPYCKQSKVKKSTNSVQPTSTQASPAPAAISSSLSPSPSTSFNKSHGPVQGKALYDYAATNSDEVSLVEGDIVVLSGEEDEAGWIKVSNKGVTGLAPKSFIEVIAGSVKQATVVAPVKASPATSKPPAVKALPQFRVIYDYVAQSDRELSIKEGDIIEVIKQGDEGWWEGRLKGKTGEFPGNYVEQM